MAITEKTYQMDLRVVLVRSLYDRNIGATSRAMANMGISRLILVAPQCEITFSAQQAAARGQGPLQNAVIYSSWDDFFAKEPDSLRISFTARDGRARQVHEFENVYQKLKTSELFLNSNKKPISVHFVFGPEDCGLSDQDLNLTHFSACLPTYGENLSLNLAQAVLLALFSLRHFIKQDAQSFQCQFLNEQYNVVSTASAKTKSKDQRISSQNISFPEEMLKNWLTELGFNLSQRKVNVFTVLKRMLLHSVPTDKELRILEVVLQQNIRKLKEWKKLKKT